jgi:DinB superfamily
MLLQVISRCPESLWLTPDYPNRFWHIAYHAVFYTHLYLQPSEAEFIPWRKHRADYQFLGPTPWPPHERPKILEPYTRTEILEYREVCLEEIDHRLHSPDLGLPSGFHWLPFSRMELHLYNVRHLQHHVGQLVDRLRSADNIGIPWVGTV